MKRRSIEDIRKAFEREGYTLLTDTYVNNISHLPYKCPKGHYNSVGWNNFNRGTRCPDCHGGKKLTISDIAKKFEERGFRLLSTTYESRHTPIKYICNKGHENDTTWDNFVHGHFCSRCENESKRLTIEEVKHAFIDIGYTLLSKEYINRNGYLSYICKEKHEGTITWDRFCKGNRCRTCCELKREKQLGKMLEEMFPTKRVGHQDHLDILGLQRADFSIREMKLVVEHDGLQHFQPVVGIYGCQTIEEAEVRFRLQQKRDRRKNRLCKKHGYKILHIKYNDPLTKEYIKQKIDAILQ